MMLSLAENAFSADESVPWLFHSSAGIHNIKISHLTEYKGLVFFFFFVNGILEVLKINTFTVYQ